jgi:hypothetical protein
LLFVKVLHCFIKRQGRIREDHCDRFVRRTSPARRESKQFGNRTCDRLTEDIVCFCNDGCSGRAFHAGHPALCDIDTFNGTFDGCAVATEDAFFRAARNIVDGLKCPTLPRRINVRALGRKVDRLRRHHLENRIVPLSSPVHAPVPYFLAHAAIGEKIIGNPGDFFFVFCPPTVMLRSQPPGFLLSAQEFVPLCPMSS